jgi:hypothetical protein
LSGSGGSSPTPTDGVSPDISGLDWHELRLRADYNPSLAGDLLYEAQMVQLEAPTFVNEMRQRLPAHLR